MRTIEHFVFSERTGHLSWACFYSVHDSTNITHALVVRQAKKGQELNAMRIHDLYSTSTGIWWNSSFELADTEWEASNLGSEASMGLKHGDIKIIDLLKTELNEWLAVDPQSDLYIVRPERLREFAGEKMLHHVSEGLEPAIGVIADVTGPIPELPL